MTLLPALSYPETGGHEDKPEHHSRCTLGIARTLKLRTRRPDATIAKRPILGRQGG